LILVNTSLGEQGDVVLTLLLLLLDLGFILQDDSLSLVSEDFLDSWYDIGDLDDFLHEDVDAIEQLLVSWVMDDVPVSLVLGVKDREDLEDWDQFLTEWVANDSLVEIKQGDLN
jgi:hypothetical protein